MKVKPLVSIIIPTYNRVDLLQETLKSILNQSYKNFEVIIVSDKSTDNTAAIIKANNDHRIRFFELEKNLKFPSRVRNIGIEKARGKFIAFCDDDDLWTKQKLEIQIKYITSHENIEMVASNSFLFPGHIVPSMQLWRNKLLTYKEILNVNSIITPSVLIRKSTLDKIGKFDEHEKLHIGEDWDLWIRVLQYREESIIILRECLVFNRLGNVKITNSFYDPKIFMEAKLHIFEKHKPTTIPKIHELLNNWGHEIGIHYNKDLVQNFTKEFYSKNINFFQFLKSRNLNFKKKGFILSKLIMKYLYKILFQLKNISIESDKLKDTSSL